MARSRVRAIAAAGRRPQRRPDPDDEEPNRKEREDHVSSRTLVLPAPLVVITAWIGLLIGLAVMSQAVKTSYDNSFTLPGTGSGSAQELLQRSAPAQAGDSDQIVWQVSHGSVTDPAIEQRMSAMLARVSHLPEVASVASPYRAGRQGPGEARTGAPRTPR